MTITNISSASVWAGSSGQREISVTIVRPGGRGWALAESALARVSGSGTAYSWISATRTQPGGDQILVSLSPEPDGARSAQWISDCLSATITLRVVNEYAFATARLSLWN